MSHRAESARRTHAKLIRFTDAESAMVFARARAAGRPVASYIREAAIGQAPRQRRSELSDALTRRLARLATQLATLAAQARDQGLASRDDFTAGVTDILEIIRQLD